MQSASDIQQFQKQVQNETNKKCLEDVSLHCRQDTEGIWTRHREKAHELIDQLFPSPILVDTANGDTVDSKPATYENGSNRRVTDTYCSEAVVRQDGQLTLYPLGTHQVIVLYPESKDANSQRPDSITVASTSGTMEFKLRENDTYAISLDGKTHESLRIGVKLCQLTGEIHFSNRKNTTGYLGANGMLHGSIEPFLITDEGLVRQAGSDARSNGSQLSRAQVMPAQQRSELIPAY